MFRAFYSPKQGDYHETLVDANALEDLPSGAFLVIKMNEDGTRELISEKRNLPPKDERFYQYALRHLEYKHDGGNTPEMYLELKKDRD